MTVEVRHPRRAQDRFGFLDVEADFGGVDAGAGEEVLRHVVGVRAEVRGSAMEGVLCNIFHRSI